MKNFLWIILILAFGCKDSTLQKTESLTEPAPSLTTLNHPAQEMSALPRLFGTDDGLNFCWVAKKDSLSHLQYATYVNGEWSEPHEIASGHDWFVNWADFPQIAQNKDLILTSFLQKSANGTYTYDVKLNLTTDQEMIVKDHFILHNDGTLSEHGFVSMSPWKDSFFVSWLDGRNTIGDQMDHNMHGGSGAMTLRGAFVNLDGSITDSVELDARVCDCCNTASTVTSNGILVAYRDRSEEEIRDISVVRYENGAWGKPQTIGSDQWKIAGCPVNGPAIDAINNNVAVAWFTGVDEEGKVQLLFSEDEGRTFGSPIRIDAGNATGRIDVVMLNEMEAGVLWMEPNGKEELIQFMKVSLQGKKSKVLTVARTSAERASGFPQLEKSRKSLYAAWTLNSDGNSIIKMAQIFPENL